MADLTPAEIRRKRKQIDAKQARIHQKMEALILESAALMRQCKHPRIEFPIGEPSYCADCGYEGFGGNHDAD